MEFKTCKNCCMVFQYSGIGAELCSDCKSKEDKYLEKVQEILAKDPGTKVTEIMELTGVPENTLEKFVKDKQIVLQEYTSPAITCAMCGISIQNGRYCAACDRKIKAEISKQQSLYWHPDTKSQIQAMRFIKHKNQG